MDIRLLEMERCFALRIWSDSDQMGELSESGVRRETTFTNALLQTFASREPQLSKSKILLAGRKCAFFCSWLSHKRPLLELTHFLLVLIIILRNTSYTNIDSTPAFPLCSLPSLLSTCRSSTCSLSLSQRIDLFYHPTISISLVP